MSTPIAICLREFLQLAKYAYSRARERPGRTKEARSAMMEITTSSSTSEKPFLTSMPLSCRDGGDVSTMYPCGREGG
jgi:hypothetical protein